MKQQCIRIVFAFAAFPAVAGPYDQPYALFVPAHRSEVRDIEPAMVVAVDGKPTRGRRAEPVAPGFHEVEVSLPSPRGTSRPGREVITIAAEPCTRYYIGAQRSTATSRDWSAFVERSEAIGECDVQTATVQRDAARFTLVMHEAPRYVAIDGTTLVYVANAKVPVIRVSPGAYYALQAGVWFTASTLSGPWIVATTVPAAIYAIPASSPVHYVTYVRIYNATPTAVYVGYAPTYVVTAYGGTSVNVYGHWGEAYNTATGVSAQGAAGTVTGPNGETHSAVAGRLGDDRYANVDGTQYRHTGNGWERRDASTGEWAPAKRSRSSQPTRPEARRR